MKRILKYYLSGIVILMNAVPASAEGLNESTIMPYLFASLAALLVLTAIVLFTVLKARASLKNQRTSGQTALPRLRLEDLDTAEIAVLLEARRSRLVKSAGSRFAGKATALLVALVACSPLFAEAASGSGDGLLSQPGIVITIVLILIPLFVGVIYLVSKINRLIRQFNQGEKERRAQQLADYLLYLDGEEIEPALLKRKASLERTLNHTELSGILRSEDVNGIILRATTKTDIQFVATKKKAVKRPPIDPRFSKLVIWYLASAIVWLVFGTTVGEYVGIKFVVPDVDHQSWLTFGRLRPVHTNAVFWGWSSLGMLGLGYYVVSVVSNKPIASLRKGWISLALINASVIIGTLCLMAGVNNGGGEYREYIWPVMALFGGGLVLTLINFIQTIARRTTREIYISNWYIVSAIIFTLVIAFIAYWPTWQDGLGETIVQGYYMHQGVGMWFMLFSLGIVYYFLPQQLNKPIYSYSLGILAFWTQILFYTVIGTHHFVFSSIPWSLQTVAIVGSMGMVIPVIAGTTNFLMTFKGDFHRISNSYTLPFYLVGIVFYFTGSLQGTAEAFRYTNQLWHFTDFTVAHSHITMYGIIAFLLWASIYAVVPRMTGREPSQVMVGAHFWLAFIGLLLYSVPLMIGGTLKGLMWMDGKAFIESVSMMAPYWLWRAIGGSMMWLSHLIFAYNFYTMVSRRRESDIKELAFVKLGKIAATVREEQLVN